MRGCARPSASSKSSAKEARPVPRSRANRLKEAKRRLDEELWTELRANAAYERYRSGRMKDGRRFSRPPDPYTPPEIPAGEVNLTDPDSRVVKGSRGRGFMQGYNAQAVVNEHQIVIAAEVMNVAPDFGHLEPMLDAARRELAAVGVDKAPEVLVADAGYWHQQQMERIIDRGVQVLIPPDAKSREGTRPGWDGGYYAFMRRVLSSGRGGELYGQRQAIIEPVFADTKFNRAIDRFRRRGRAAVRAEWRLITATHNLLKLHRHATAAARAPRRAAAVPSRELHPLKRRYRNRSLHRLTRQPRRAAEARGNPLLLHGCSSGTGSDRAPADARSSSRASVAGSAVRALAGFNNAGVV